MRMQQIIPQQTSQYQHGYPLVNLDLIQQQQLGASRVNSTKQRQNTVHQQDVQGHRSPASARAQPQPQTQDRQSCIERDPMKRQKTEELKKKLQGRRIPEEDWQCYLSPPHTWDYSITSTSGLCQGIEVVLLTPLAYTPIWVDENSLGRFRQLRSKLKAVMNMKGEIDEFNQNEDPDDNYFMFSFKQAGKKADSLKKDL